MLVVVPALNEEESVARVIGEVKSSLPDAHVLVVDDGSGDQTSAVAASSGADVVTLPFNLGVGGALRTGFRFAQRYGYQEMVQVDADGQHNPADIGRLVALLDSADLVIGARFAGEGDYRVGFVRRLVMRTLAHLISRQTGAELTDVTSGFRAFGPKAISLFAREYPAEYLGDTVEALLLAGRAGLTVRQVPVQMRQRQGGQASHSQLMAGLMVFRVLPAFIFKRHRRVRGQRTEGVSP